jgi:tetratricopeptide (TPR) repeat protein
MVSRIDSQTPSDDAQGRNDRFSAQSSLFHIQRGEGPSYSKTLPRSTMDNHSREASWSAAVLRRFRAVIEQFPKCVRWQTNTGLIFALLLLISSTAKAAPSFTAALDRDTISLGETVTFTITFEDCAPTADPRLPAMEGLEFAGGGRSEQVSIVNGASSESTTYTYDVRPTRQGDFNIPALSADTDHGRLNSRPLRLRVVKGNIPQASGVPETAFVRLVPSTNTVYVGETIPVDLQCYCQDNVGNIQLPQFASDAFIVGNVPNKPGQSHVRVGNLMYTLFDFRVGATATRAGKQPLGPATWNLTVYTGQRTFFGWTGAHQGNFTSDAPEIKVLPVPTAGAPADFRGAIGDFTLTQCEAGPTSVGVGDPITLKVRIQGTGSFDTVTLPASQSDWREFKTYPPTAKFDSSDPLQIEGAKSFEQVITPLNAQVTQIPPFSFSFFDPATGSFRTLTHPAIPLTVHPTAATPQPTIIASGMTSPEAQQQNQDIVHIKPLPGRVGTITPPLVQQPMYLALQAIAPLAWVCAVFWRRKKEKLANNPRMRRQREVARIVREGLVDLSQLAAANDVEKFYSTVLRLLQEQLGERLDLPAPAITEAVLEDCKGLDAAASASVRDLFNACEQYRYTPEHTAQELASLIPKVGTALEVVRNMPATGAGRRRTLVRGAGALLLLAGVVTARADAVAAPFEQANKLYEEGHYAEAAAAYENLLNHNSVSPAIYFNAGNAWYKAGQIGRAIYNYRRAEELAPRDPDIRANLQIARTQAGTNTASPPGNRWTRWIGRLTLNEWTVAASASVAVFFFVLMARQISPRLTRSTGGLTLSLGVLSVWLMACLALSIDQRVFEESSIVIVPEAVARRGPMDESQSAFTIHDGAELAVQARDGEWLQVTGPSREMGWLPQKDVALIP